MGHRIDTIRLVVFVVFTTGLCMLVLASCPNPIDNTVVSQLSDNKSPTIVLEKPEDRSEYSTQVQVSGSVTDEGGTERISACSYTVLGTTVKGDFSIDENGNFDFFFSTRESDGTQLFDGPVTLELKVCDWRGNEATVSAQLLQAHTGDIPGFEVIQGNKHALVSWDPVPGAERYVLYENKYGLKRENVHSQYRWDDLENGSLYSFRLKAEIAGDTADDAISSSVDIMPMSSRTFAPRLHVSEYKSISIEWWENENVQDYTVERRVLPDGPWEVRRNLKESTFTDERVEFGRHYAYRVRPSEEADIVSSTITETPGRFTSTIDNGLISSCPTRGDAKGLAIEGDYAYVADGNEGLQIIDISDPFNPNRVGSWGPCEDAVIAVSIDSLNENAYVLNGIGLQVIDISSPTNPKSISKVCPTDGYACGLALQAGYAYITDGSNGLQIIDISDSSDPEIIGEGCDLGGNAVDVTVSGDYAYIANSSGGLQIVRIFNPEKPTLEGEGDLFCCANGVAIDGSFAYLSCFNMGLQVFLISNPKSPTNEGSYYFTGYGQDVALSGSHAYVTVINDQQIGILRDISISNPTSPVEMGDGCSMEGHASTVKVVGRYAYVVDGNGLQIIDRATLNGASLTGGGYTTGGTAYDVKVAEDVAYLADGGEGLHFIDISYPNIPSPIGDGWTSEGAVYSAAVSGNKVYVTINEYPNGGNLQILDITDLENPSLMGECALIGSQVKEVALAGDYAYVAAGTDGMGTGSLEVVDISDPEQPYRPCAGCSPGDDPHGVTIVGDYAYVAADSQGLQVIDISIPTAPLLYGAGCNTIGTALDVAVAGTYAFVTVGNAGLEVLDISDPSNPVPYGSGCSTAGFARRISIAGDFAFVCDGSSGLQIIDISDPSQPERIGSGFSTADYARGLAVSHEHAYIADDDAGLQVIDLYGGD